MTLNETLAALGYTTAPYIMADKNILRGGVIVFTGDSVQVWAWLRKTGQMA